MSILDKGRFIKAVLPGAMTAFKKEHILPSLTIAQALLEGANGQSCPGNNCFGIKWTEGCGYEKQLLWTHEWNPKIKALEKVQSPFRKYKTLADCVLDHSKVLSVARYESVRACKNFKSACEQIKKDGYATDPKYPTLLISIITSNKLYQYDK
jgi:flagellum-specific peptidoglycan hydrolase FlgJ